MLSREEKRRLHIDKLMSEATTLGVKISREDFEHEDIDDDDDYPDVYMTDEQIKMMKEAERAFVARDRRPAPPLPTRPPEVQHSVFNVVRLDAAIRSDVSDPLKNQLIMYAPIERLYSLLKSWQLQERDFDNNKMLVTHLARFGCTCIKQQDCGRATELRFSMDMYYHQKREEAAKKKLRRREVRTALRVARNAARMSTLRRHAIKDNEMPGSSSDEEDTSFDPSKALAVACGDKNDNGNGSLSTLQQKNKTRESETVEEDEVPAFADDHALLVVKTEPAPHKNYLVLTDVHFVVWDPDL